MTQSSPPPLHQPPSTPKIEQWITLTVLALLVIGCYLVLQPFLSAVLWAIVLCCATWPAFIGLKRLTNGRTILAASLMTLAIALVLLAPFAVVGLTLAESADELLSLMKRLLEAGPPDLPDWITTLPLIGERVQNYWAGLASDSATLLAELQKLLQPLKPMALASGALLAQGILQLTLSILIAFFVYRDGETASTRLQTTVERIAGANARHLVLVAAATTRGVVYGILGTALIQGVLAGLGFWLAGVPAAPLLGLITFFLSPLPIGPPLVWFPAAIWLFNHDATAWGVFMLIWGVAVVSSVDNIIKPLIISRGSNLPFILVLLGILGGIVAFGFIGVFLGPTLLAVGYAVLQEWSAEQSESSQAD